MYFFVFLSLIQFVSCQDNSDTKNNYEKNIKKVIITKSFDTKARFDSFTIEKPAHNLGYDKTLGMDFEWSVKYMDTFNNPIKVERIRTDSSGKEEVFETVTYQYADPKKSLVSLESTQGIYSNKKTEYIRDKKGLLKQIVETRSNEIIEKTVYAYDFKGKLLKESIYREDGLVEVTEFEFKSGKDSGYILREVRNGIKPGFKFETDKYYSENRRCFMSIEKKSEGNFTSKIVNRYENFIGDIPTLCVREGINLPIKVKNLYDYEQEEIVPAEPFICTIKTVLNQHGHITRYEVSYKNVNDYKFTVGEPFNSNLNGNRLYLCNYTYNEKNDWIRAILEDHDTKYLIIREIKYLH